MLNGHGVSFGGAGDQYVLDLDNEDWWNNISHILKTTKLYTL